MSQSCTCKSLKYDLRLSGGVCHIRLFFLYFAMNDKRNQSCKICILKLNLTVGETIKKFLAKETCFYSIYKLENISLLREHCSKLFRDITRFNLILHCEC